ncbi:MAG: CoA-binding protein [Candidatus Levybacteria bacterium]|nr:CoA-binding protein [Candidatus Levybacteria bacterium]
MSLKKQLDGVKTIAIVGLSDKPERYSYKVASYLQSQGFRIIPVNPNITHVLGEKAYPDLLSIPKDTKVDLVDIFRRSEEVLAHVREAVERGDVKTIWMQEGVVNEEAKIYAETKGLEVVMNFCLMIFHKEKHQSNVNA